MCEYNLSVRSLYSSISNQDLDVIVEQIQQRFGLCARASTSPRNQESRRRVVLYCAD